MEPTTTEQLLQTSAGWKSVAELAAATAGKYGDRPAIRLKRDGEWTQLSYSEVGETISQVGRGIVDLGIQGGDRVCLLADTSPEWTYSDFGIAAAGAVVVPIYPTNSPEECEWVAGNSGARAVICENEAQLEKIRKVRDALPELEHLIAIDADAAGDGVISLDELRERGRDRDVSELEERAAAVQGDDPYTFVYTSGTTGPPKGCVLTHRNFASVCGAIRELSTVRPDDVSYLYLPLAHVFARIVELATFDFGASIAYMAGGTRQIIPELSEVHPTYLPSVPRIFEKLYTLANAQLENATPEQREQFHQAVKLGVKVRDMEGRGEEVPDEMRRHFEAADEQIFKNVRALFGGKVREAGTGAAPIAPEILEFFYAAGIPVLEGYGMTETTAAATISTVENHRFGTVGRPLPGIEVRIADDGELLIKGPNIFAGYWRNEDATRETVIDGWLHTGDLGEIDEDGYVKITGRKKDIIITAGGKNLTPANLENDLKQSRWISQAVMYGDRRPYPVALVTLDEEEIVPWAKEKGLPTDLATLAENEEVRAMIQEHLDEANAKYAQVEQIKKFKILDHDLSQETGELTPTLKVKRNVVNEKYEDLFEQLYSR
jgi:long-chain acyl-CoA synthetase